MNTGLDWVDRPAQPEVTPAIAACKGAGIRLITVTGDNPDMARAIATSMGLDGSEGQLLSGTQLDALTDTALQEQVDHVAIVTRDTEAQAAHRRGAART